MKKLLSVAAAAAILLSGTVSPCRRAEAFPAGSAFSFSAFAQTVSHPIGGLYGISEKDLASFSSYIYDANEGGRDVSTADKKTLSEIWSALGKLELFEKADADADLYFDALGVSAKAPVQVFTLTLTDGRELMFMFYFDLNGVKYLGIDILHSADAEGELFFVHDFEDTFRCDYTELVGTLVRLFGTASGGEGADAEKASGENAKLIGWQEIDGKKLYYVDYNVPAAGPTVIDGVCCDFSEDGVYIGRYTGFLKTIQGTQYWKDGSTVDDQWITVDGARYHTSNEGFVRVGEHVIDGYTYNFGKDGKWDGKRTKYKGPSTGIKRLDEIFDSKFVSVSAVYDNGEGGGKYVFSRDKELISELVLRLRRIIYGGKTAEDERVYIDSMHNHGEPEPVLSFSMGLKDGSELTALFAFDEEGRRCLPLDLHSREEAGRGYYEYSYDDTYYCNYGSLRDWLTGELEKLPASTVKVKKGTPAVTGQVSGTGAVPANSAYLAAATFYVPDRSNKYMMNYEFRLEKKTGGKWTEVKPIGELKFSEDQKKFRQVLTFTQELPLMYYPPLGEGRYRVVKPYKKVGSDKLREAYGEFDVKDVGEYWKCPARLTFEKKRYGTGETVIGMLCAADDSASFSYGCVYDVERYEDGKWQSVRTAEIAYRAGGSYTVSSGKSQIRITPDDFDLSRSGRYRVRVSVNEIRDGYVKITENHAVVYGYFELKKPELSKISVSIENDCCEVSKKLIVNIRNDGETDAFLDRVSIEDLAGNKLPFEVRGSCVVPAGSEFTYETLRFTDRVPVGGAKLIMTFSAYRCEDETVKNKTVTAYFTVRKATEEENNSGIFFELEKSVYDPEPWEIKMKVTNMSLDKNDIVVLLVGADKDGETAGPGYVDIERSTRGRTGEVIKYGESKWITLVNVGVRPIEDYLAMTGLDLLYGTVFTDRDLEEVRERLEEEQKDPVFRVAEKGIYTISVTWESTADELDFGTEYLTFEIK